MRYTVHARVEMQRREIADDWVESTVRAPEFERRDRRYPERRNAFRRVPQLENRWLRVVYEIDGADILIVTAFLDRGAERRR